MSCPDVTVMIGGAYLLTYLLYRIGLVRFLYSPIPQAGTLAPVGFPTTRHEEQECGVGMCSRVTHHLCYTSRHEDRSEGRNVFTCDSPSSSPSYH